MFGSRSPRAYVRMLRPSAEISCTVPLCGEPARKPGMICGDVFGPLSSAPPTDT